MERLPSEITTNILSRLRVKPSARCRCVSKLWCEILSDPKLLLNQLSSISPDVLLYEFFSTRIYYLEDDEEYNEAFNTEESIKPLKMFDKPFIVETFYETPTILGFCKGLICISPSLLRVNPIYIFNPVTEKYLQLPHYTQPEGFASSIQHRLQTNCLHGFGFEDSKQEFKLVIVTFFGNVQDWPRILRNEVQVLTLGSTTWTKRVGIVPDVLCQASGIRSWAFVNGCLHWITMNKNSAKDLQHIVSFNLGAEEFAFVPTPEFLNLSYNLGVLEENLSAVEYSEHNLDIWVMKKYNVKESWVKQFSIKRDLLCLHSGMCYLAEIIKFRRNGELLLICKANCVVSYNVTSQKCRLLKVEGVEERRETSILGCPIVGSLISLKSALGMDSDTREA